MNTNENIATLNVDILHRHDVEKKKSVQGLTGGAVV